MMPLPSSGPITMTQINTEFGRGTNLNSYRGTSYFSGQSGPFSFPSGAIAFSDFRSTFKYLPVTVTAYVIGGGGRSRQDTSGGSGGGGAAVIQTSLTESVSTLTVVVGSGATSYSSSGGNSSVQNANITAIGRGGVGNPSGPPCGGCLNGPPAAGGTASGGNLNLSGGFGSGYNQYFDAPCCTIGQVSGGDGASGVFNGVTYYAAGGGGGASDLVDGTPGGAGGSYAGSGGYGYYSNPGQSGNLYGGGSGGGRRNNGGTGVGGNGAVIISYQSATQLGFGGQSVTFNGTTWTHVFTSSGTFTTI